MSHCRKCRGECLKNGICPRCDSVEKSVARLKAMARERMLTRPRRRDNSGGSWWLRKARDYAQQVQPELSGQDAALPPGDR